MIWGIGIDIIEVERIDKAVSNERFLNKVFTEHERQYCETRGCHKGQSYAARFAAKEAFVKALGTGLRNGTLKEIEIINNELGQPQIILNGWFAEYINDNHINVICVSLSHTKSYAAANVLLAKE